MCKVNAVKIRGGERARERERERERDSTRVERVCPTPCISTPWLHVSPMCHPMCHPICTTMSLPMCHPILTRSLSIQNASTALSPSKRRVYVNVGWTKREEEEDLLLLKANTVNEVGTTRDRATSAQETKTAGRSMKRGRLENVMCVRLDA